MKASKAARGEARIQQSLAEQQIIVSAARRAGAASLESTKRMVREAEGKALYDACPTVKPLWDDLGEVTKEVWREKADAKEQQK